MYYVPDILFSFLQENIVHILVILLRKEHPFRFLNRENDKNKHSPLNEIVFIEISYLKKSMAEARAIFYGPTFYNH